MQLWELIRGLVSDGTTLLLTTQYMEEADQLADTITVIDLGKVIDPFDFSPRAVDDWRNFIHIARQGSFVIW